MLNKAQAKQVSFIHIYMSCDMPDVAARTLSALIRSSLRKSATVELMKIAIQFDLLNHPEFIIK